MKTPPRMLAAVHTRYGPPEVISIREVDTPQSKPNEVLIRIYAATVNRTDCGFRSAEYVISRLFSGLFAPRNPTLGCEFAGEVVQVGNSVSAYRVGDRVLGFDDAGFGAHAEYKTISAAGPIVPFPIDISYETAAALTEGGHYALCNIRAAKVKPGDQVLVYGATGAIGSAAVQLLKHFGAFVVAVAGTAHQDLVRSMGADEVIDYQTQDFTATPHRFDLVFDAVGKSSFGQCKPLLKPAGLYVSTELGPGGQNVYLAMVGAFRRRAKRVIFPIPVTRNADLELLRDLHLAGKFRPLIDRNYPLADIVEAYRYVETGQKIGNVVLHLVANTGSASA